MNPSLNVDPDDEDPQFGPREWFYYMFAFGALALYAIASWCIPNPFWKHLIQYATFTLICLEYLGLSLARIRRRQLPAWKIWGRVAITFSVSAVGIAVSVWYAKNIGMPLMGFILFRCIMGILVEELRLREQPPGQPASPAL